MYRRVVHIFGGICFLTTLGLLGLHFIVKDGSREAALWFYAFPLPVVILIALITAVCMPRHLKKYTFLGVFILIAVWLSSSLKLNTQDAEDALDFEVLFWNASHDNDFSDAFAINGRLPDVAVLVEYDSRLLPTISTTYGMYHTYIDTIQNIGIFSKTPLFLEAITRTKYQSAVLHFRTKDIDFYAVDVTGSIDVPRAWELEFVNSAIPSNPVRNSVVLGDFNVPFESLLLAPITSNYKHAFSAKGFGLRETWCYGLPLLSLDHIWVSKDVILKQVTKLNTLQSDHAMLRMVMHN